MYFDKQCYFYGSSNILTFTIIVRVQRILIAILMQIASQRRKITLTRNSQNQNKRNALKRQ